MAPAGPKWDRPVAVKKRRLLPVSHLDDGAVQDGMAVALAQRYLLFDGVDLVVAGDQRRGSAGLPGENGFVPQRAVGGLTRLRAEDGELAVCGHPLDQVDLGQAAGLDALQTGGEVDAHHLRL